MREHPSRRRLVTVAAGVGVGLLAGCAGSNGEGPESGTDPPTDPGPTGTDTTVSATDAPDLDLREANVVGVAVERDGDAYDFAVTLHHDDDGEEGYANWWQVEDLDGERLGRRDLLHAHSDQPFTRSTTVEVPDGVTCVVVRGHDRTHGYGGRLAVVDPDSGASAPVDQGSDRQSVDAGDCPSA